MNSNLTVFFFVVVVGFFLFGEIKSVESCTGSGAI